MGEGLGAWWGEVCVCRGDTICFILSQQQQLQTYVLMGLGLIKNPLFCPFIFFSSLAYWFACAVSDALTSRC